jgi:hypothetical protein
MPVARWRRLAGREEIIAAGETDWRKAAARLTGPVPGRKAAHVSA